MKKSFLLSILFTSLALNSTAGDYDPAKAISLDEHDTLEAFDHTRVDAHAPIGVMGDHLHHEGEMMLSYRYMRMDMRPNFVGSDEVTAQSQLRPNGGNFMIMPTDMQTEMHMVGLMYAPSDEVTLSFMLPIIDKTMDHITAAGTNFTTATNGIGDFKFGGLVKLYEQENVKGHLNLMISAPTGSVQETGFVAPAGQVIRLPYPMQLGSGTWDFRPGVTFLGQNGNFSWGSQLLGTVRLGENNENYSLGDDITANIWGALKLSDSVSTSLRLSGTSWGDIDGRDPLIAGPVPTADPSIQGGERIDLFYGVNYLFTNGALKGHRLAVEAGKPLYQDLDGPRLGMDWMMTVGWQKAW
ncbi:MAG: hypothetical protein P1U58_11375 [Verrucomicrobiales bacterium]|nr:hypothetical protein [Verrucomicrobiales bacterium]